MGIVSRGNCRISGFTVSNYRINDNIPISVDIYYENCKADVKNNKIRIKRTKKVYKSEETFYLENYEVNFLMFKLKIVFIMKFN